MTKDENIWFAVDALKEDINKRVDRFKEEWGDKSNIIFNIDRKIDTHTYPHDVRHDITLTLTHKEDVE